MEKYHWKKILSTIPLLVYGIAIVFFVSWCSSLLPKTENDCISYDDYCGPDYYETLGY